MTAGPTVTISLNAGQSAAVDLFSPAAQEVLTTLNASAGS